MSKQLQIKGDSLYNLAESDITQSMAEFFISRINIIGSGELEIILNFSDIFAEELK